MKKILSIVVLSAACAMVSAATASAPALAQQPAPTQQTRLRSDAMDKFSKITLSGKLNVELIPSGRDSISITLFDSDLAKFKWNIANDELSASLRPTIGGRGRAEIKIYYAEPIVSISGSGSEILIQQPIKSHILTLAIGSGGKLTAAVECADLELNAAGTSTVTVTGSTKYLTLRASESSKVDARYLQSFSAQVNASTSAEVYVWATDRAVISAGSGATVFYRGNPAILKTSIPKLNLGASITSIGV